MKQDLVKVIKKFRIIDKSIELFWGNLEKFKTNPECAEEYHRIFGEFNEKSLKLYLKKIRYNLDAASIDSKEFITVQIDMIYKENKIGYYEVYFNMKGERKDDYFVTYPFPVIENKNNKYYREDIENRLDNLMIQKQKKTWKDNKKFNFMKQDLLEFIEKFNIINRSMETFWEIFENYKTDPDYKEEFDEIFGEFDEKSFTVSMKEISYNLHSVSEDSYEYINLYIQMVYKGEQIGRYKPIFDMKGEWEDDYFVTYTVNTKNRVWQLTD